MKHTYSILLILLLCFFGACTENTMLTYQPEPTPDEEGLEEVSLNLKSLPVRIIGEEWNAEAQTRVATTSNSDENKISNIWVLQYNAAGTLLLTAPRYYTLNPVINTTGSITVMLRPATNSVIHIIANTNNSGWLKNTDVSTPAKLNNLTFTFNNESAVYGGTNKNLLMSGNTTATIKAGVTNNLGTINLKRMVAKINFKYTLATAVQGKLTVTKITIENIPNIIKVGEPTATYPTTLTSCSYNEVTAPTAGNKYTWYVPENLQGSTANTNEKTKNEGAPGNALIIRLYIDSQLDGNNYVYTLYPGENKTNDFNIKRNCDYNVSLTLNSSATDSRVMAAPANCFVMKTQTSIIFDPYDRTEKGGGFNYSQYVNKGVPAQKITKVNILWQTGNGTNYAIGNNSAGNLVYIDNKDKIHVTAGKINGNAVIAGYNNSNEIVWSWHIWVNDNMPAQISKAVPYTTYDWDATGINTSKRVTGKPVMSCNLGALGNDNTVGASSYGLLYQWGRKDPFPQGKENLHHDSYPYSFQYIVDVYDNAAKQIAMTSTVGTGELFQTIMASSSTGTIGYVLKNPTHFIKTTNVENSSNSNEHVNDGDWCWNHNDRLWGGKPVKEATKKFQTSTPHNLLLANNGATEKSIFDPCPSGWMLAPGDMWLGFTINGYNASSYTDINCSESSASENSLNYGYHIYMEGWKNGKTVYFPSQGLRQCNGAPWRNGVCGNYHTSTPGEGGTVYILHLHTTSSIKIYEESYAYTRRSVAGPVRCVRETK